MVSKKKIHNLCEDGIEKSVPRAHCLSPPASPVMPIADPRDECFYPLHTHDGFL